jgi:RNA polymerase sigma-70 factor, ECF subfamily
MAVQSFRTDDCIDDVIAVYSAMVYRLAFAKVRNKHDADDVFQDVFVSYILANKTYENEEHRKAWLIKVTINCGNKYLASTWLKRIVPLNDSLSYTFDMQDETDLHRSLLQLPQRYRTVIHLFYYEELSIEQISDILNAKPSAVRTWLTRARKKLRHHMETEDDKNESCTI